MVASRSFFSASLFAGLARTITPSVGPLLPHFVGSLPLAANAWRLHRCVVKSVILNHLLGAPSLCRHRKTTRFFFRCRALHGHKPISWDLSRLIVRPPHQAAPRLIHQPPLAVRRSIAALASSTISACSFLDRIRGDVRRLADPRPSTCELRIFPQREQQPTACTRRFGGFLGKPDKRYGLPMARASPRTFADGDLAQA